LIYFDYRYVSPELLDEDICQGPADLWALGCICYKLLTGKTPFYDASEFLIFQNVKQVKFTIPEGVPEEAASLIKALLKRDPTSRLGAGPVGTLNDYNALKRHEFFSTVDFANIFGKEAPVYNIANAPRYDTLLDPDLQMGKRKEEGGSSKDSK
jgi:3-phosphoinositide dependent protein kinase-1